MNDVPRYASYIYMEVYNSDTKKYEKYNKTDHVEVDVVIDTDVKLLTYKDAYNNTDKRYTILNCKMDDTDMIYECADVDNKRKCMFIFSSDKSLTVVYACEPIVYRVKQKAP
jgi:hypothetical protein